MSRNNTGNPIGSGDPRDREDNSKNLDVAVNSMAATWIDRFGTERLTMSGAIDPSGIAGAAIGAKNEAQAAAERAEAAADVAEQVADMGSYLTKADADAALPLPEGTVVRVTNDPDPANNGFWVSDGAELVWSGLQPVNKIYVDSLDYAVPGNAYPDPNFVDLAGISSGVPIQRLPTNVAAPNSHYIMADEDAGDFTVSTKLWPVVAGAQYRYLTRYGNINSGGGGAPMDVTAHVEYYSDHSAQTLIESRQLSQVVSTVAQTRVSYDTAPAGAVCARFRFDKTGSGGTNMLVSTLDVRQLIDGDMLSGRAYEGIANPGRETISATEERGSLTTSLAPGGVENRPPVLDVEAIAGSSGPSLLFRGLATVGRRRMIDLGPDVAERRLRVDYLISRRGPAAGGIAVDVEFGVAWYDNTGQAAATPETIHASLSQIGFGITAHTFSFGRVASADIVAPSDAYLAIPFVRFLTDSPNALPLVRSIDVYIDQRGGSGDDDEGELLPPQDSDTITRFDLPLRISVADAEHLSPADRALREWYYIEGALVHRDDLPAFAPATPAMSIDFPAGEASTHTINAGTQIITLNARMSNVSGISRRLIAVQADGVQGMTPLIEVTRADDWNAPLTLTRHRMSWSPDLDGDDWQPFDLEAYEAGNNRWTFQNTYPFGFGRIYLSNMPFYSFGRVLRKDMEWARNRYTRPTESAVDGYVIGTATARTAPYYSKPAPATQHTAFRVGLGSKVVVLTSGVHPDEKPGFYQLEGAMALICSETELGHRLREEFTFYVYPGVNRQGLYVGAVRWDAQSGEDANRIWGNGAITGNDLRTIYETAWATDLGDKSVAATFDFHSTAATNPATSNGAQFWFNHAQQTPEEAALIEIMTEYRAFDQIDMTATTSVTAYLRSQFNAPIGVLSEFTHAKTENIDTWRAWGRDLLRGLYAMREQL